MIHNWNFLNFYQLLNDLTQKKKKHLFVLQDVKLGSTDTHQLSLDLDENNLSGVSQLQQQQSSNSLISNSPPLSGRSSPPVTPTSQLLQQQPFQQQSTQQQQQQRQEHQQQQHQYQLLHQQEPLELQIDYWPIVKPMLNEKEKSQTKGSDQGKNSIKSTFRSLQVIFGTEQI